MHFLFEALKCFTYSISTTINVNDNFSLSIETSTFVVHISMHSTCIITLTDPLLSSKSKFAAHHTPPCSRGSSTSSDSDTSCCPKGYAEKKSHPPVKPISHSEVEDDSSEDGVNAHHCEVVSDYYVTFIQRDIHCSL